VRARDSLLGQPRSRVLAHGLGVRLPDFEANSIELTCMWLACGDASLDGINMKRSSSHESALE
jgi:hypothetical protein